MIVFGSCHTLSRHVEAWNGLDKTTLFEIPSTGSEPLVVHLFFKLFSHALHGMQMRLRIRASRSQQTRLLIDQTGAIAGSTSQHESTGIQIKTSPPVTGFFSGSGMQYVYFVSKRCQ